MSRMFNFYILIQSENRSTCGTRVSDNPVWTSGSRSQLSYSLKWVELKLHVFHISTIVKMLILIRLHEKYKIKLTMWRRPNVNRLIFIFKIYLLFSLMLTLFNSQFTPEKRFVPMDRIEKRTWIASGTSKCWWGPEGFPVLD